MIDRRLVVPIVVGTLILSGCGGAGDDAPVAGSTERASTTPAPAQTARRVTADVDGRALHGHCSGAPRTGTPPILLESGMGSGQGQLADIERRFASRTVVCGYDRAGVGTSDPPVRTPRRLRDLVSDLDAFATAADVAAPYLLIGQSMGANVVFAYAQDHPEKVAGFVAMNPVPPAETWLDAVKKVMTTSEFADERSYYRGENGNDEHTRFLDPMLREDLPAVMPYAVMFDENCDGDTAFCDRILPALTRATRSLARVGAGGRFVRARGAGHDIFAADPQLVHDTIDDVMRDAG